MPRFTLCRRPPLTATCTAALPVGEYSSPQTPNAHELEEVGGRSRPRGAHGRGHRHLRPDQSCTAGGGSFHDRRRRHDHQAQCSARSVGIQRRFLGAGVFARTTDQVPAPDACAAGWHELPVLPLLRQQVPGSGPARGWHVHGVSPGREDAVAGSPEAREVLQRQEADSLGAHPPCAQVRAFPAHAPCERRRHLSVVPRTGAEDAAGLPVRLAQHGMVRRLSREWVRPRQGRRGQRLQQDGDGVGAREQ